MIRTSPFDVVDFSGGITDNYLNAPSSRYKEADNFFITKNKQLFTRYGSEFYDEDYPLVTDPASTRLNTLIPIDNGEDFLAHSEEKIYHLDGGWNELVGPSGNPVFAELPIAAPPVVFDENTFVSHTTYNGHTYLTNSYMPYPTVIYRDENDVLQVRASGFLYRPSFFTFVPVRAYDAGAFAYLFAFVYRYDYYIGDTLFSFVSAPYYITGTGELTAAGAFPMAVTPNFGGSIYEDDFLLFLGSNYDTANIFIDTYRTTANGSVFYFLQTNNQADAATGPNFLEIINTTDADLVNNALLYTEGGVLPFEGPPTAKYVHVVGNTGYYAYIRQYDPNYTILASDLIDTVQISIPNSPWACPSLLRIQVGQPITGLSSADDVPLVFCQNSIYRLDGSYDATGRGAVVAQRISSSVGCVSNQSIVKVTGGCFFAGTDGFYFTDGYNLQKISSEFNTRYLSLIQTQQQRDRIYGTYDAIQQRIWWAVQSNSGALQDVDSCYILDLNYGVKPDACFTTASNGDSFAPSSLLFHNGNLLRGDRRGYLFEHLEPLRSDLLVDTGIATSAWVRKTIIYNYEGPAFDFGDAMLRKWVPMINVVAKNQSPLSLQIQSNNDDSRKIADLSPIRFRGFIIWGDADVVWGDPDIVWNYDGLITAKRHFPAKGIRCSMKQVIITNAYVIVTNSDLNGEATTDTATKEVTLTQANAEWPDNVLEYFIGFENDDYVRQFQIITRVSDTVVEVLDPLDELPFSAGSFKWQLYGKPVDERLNLLSYTIHFAPLSKTQDSYIASAQGQNNA